MSKIICVYCNKETPDGEWCTCEHCGHCPKCGKKTYHPVHFCGVAQFVAAWGCGGLWILRQGAGI